MEFWRTKVMPMVRKTFERDGYRKTCRTFDDNKEEVGKEIEEKRAELAPKIVQIYDAAPLDVKAIIKDPSEGKLKKHHSAVNKLMEELVKIEFPGSKTVRDASSKYGPVLVSGPVLFMLQKVATFIPTTEEEPAAARQPLETITARDKGVSGGEPTLASPVVIAAEVVEATGEGVEAPKE